MTFSASMHMHRTNNGGSATLTPPLPSPLPPRVTASTSSAAATPTMLTTDTLSGTSPNTRSNSSISSSTTSLHGTMPSVRRKRVFGTSAFAIGHDDDDDEGDGALSQRKSRIASTASVSTAAGDYARLRASQCPPMTLQRPQEQHPNRYASATATTRHFQAAASVPAPPLLSTSVSRHPSLTSTRPSSGEEESVTLAQMSRQMAQMTEHIAACVQQNASLISLVQRLVNLVEERTTTPQPQSQQAHPPPASKANGSASNSSKCDFNADTTPSSANSMQSPAQRTLPHRTPAVVSPPQLSNRSPQQSRPSYASTDELPPADTFEDDLMTIMAAAPFDSTTTPYASGAATTERGPISDAASDIVYHDQGQDGYSDVQVRSRPSKRPKTDDDMLDDWTAWLAPRQLSPSLQRAHYRTFKQVRLDRHLKTKRSLSAIGRIPLKQYLELDKDDYRAVRRLGRALYDQWLEPNTRIGKQDADRVSACYHKIEHAFPLLADCEEHWKARELIQQVIDNNIDDVKLQQRKQGTAQSSPSAGEAPVRKRGRPKGTTKATLIARRRESDAASGHTCNESGGENNWG